MTKARAKEKQESVDPYKRLRGRSHWKRADAARVLDDWRSSGKSMTAFARQHGLGAHRLQWWRGRVEAVAEDAPVRLVPAVVRPAPLLTLGPASPQEAVMLEVDGIRVSVCDPQGTEPGWVAALVSALRRERP